MKKKQVRDALYDDEVSALPQKQMLMLVFGVSCFKVRSGLFAGMEHRVSLTESSGGAQFRFRSHIPNLQTSIHARIKGDVMAGIGSP